MVGIVFTIISFIMLVMHGMNIVGSAIFAVIAGVGASTLNDSISVRVQDTMFFASLVRMYTKWNMSPDQIDGIIATMPESLHRTARAAKIAYLRKYQSGEMPSDKYEEMLREFSED